MSPTATRSLSEIFDELDYATSEEALALERELMALFREGNSEAEAREMIYLIMREHACNRGVHQPKEAHIWEHNSGTGENIWWCHWCGQRQRERR